MLTAAVDRIEYFHDAVQTIDETLNETELAELVTKYVRRCGITSEQN